MTSKTLIVAASELSTRMRSKAFLISLALMPLIMAIGYGVHKFTQDSVDTKDHRFVVVDRTGEIYAAIARAAEQSNQIAVQGGVQRAPRYLPSETSFAPDDEPRLFHQSKRAGERGAVHRC